MTRTGLVATAAMALLFAQTPSYAGHKHPDSGITLDGGHNHQSHAYGQHSNSIVPEGGHNFKGKKGHTNLNHWDKHHHHGIHLDGAQ